MITIAGGVIGLMCVGLIVRLVWRNPDMPLADKLPLCVLAAGLIWGGVNRAMGRPFDLGDLIMLAGLAGLIWRFHAVRKKQDGEHGR